MVDDGSDAARDCELVNLLTIDKELPSSTTPDLIWEEPLLSGFRHRPNNDGSVDSICLRCFRTIASNNHEWSLAHIGIAAPMRSCGCHEVWTFEHGRRGAG
jgi:hypothetical protein